MNDIVNLEKLLIKLKKENYSVFATTINDQLFVWRLLTRQEYEIIVKSSSGDDHLKEDMICQTAVLFPSVNFGTYKAGVAPTLAAQIIEESGFKDETKTHNYLDEARMSILQKFTDQAEIVIASAFPQYRFDEMRNWDIEQLLDMVARAEWKLNVLDGKDFLFEHAGEDEEDDKTDEDKLKELENTIIEHGGDPILQLHHIYHRDKKPYMEFPFIMGSNWDNEEVLDAIRQQQHRQ